MRQRAYIRRSQFKLCSHSLHHNLKYSTTPLVITPKTQNPQYISTSNHHIYTHLLQTCLEQCKQIQSRRLFDEMPRRALLALKINKNIHSLSIKHGFSSKGRLGNSVVDLYAKSGERDYAEKAFFMLEWRGDTLAWNSILSMYSRHGLLGNVVERFGLMRESGVVLNQFSFAIVLSACGRIMNVEFGRQLHCSVVKMGFEFDSFCEGSLIGMYAKCGRLVESRRVFDQAVEPDTVSWTAIVSGYVQGGLLEEAVEVFEEMRNLGRVPDQVAFVTVINACVRLGRIDDAWRLFSQMPNPNVVAWNVMISGHVKGGHEEEAIKLFEQMIKAGVQPTRSTLGSVLSAIASVANLDYGFQVHAQAMKQGLHSNVYVGSSLINMYAKCQKMEAVHKVFNDLEEINDVLWNALLGGYAQNGYAREVVELFMKIRVSGFQPDEFTYTSILSACACLENIEMGCQLHSIIIKSKYERNLFVGNALVDMYAKCGVLDDARIQFERIRNRDHVSWNAIIVGNVQEGEKEEAFTLFQRMMLDGIAPDEVSLASILSACANMQAVDKGRQVHCFLVKYGLETSLYASSSLIDLYSKCGDIKAATEVFSSMPERSVVATNVLISGHAQANLESAVDIFKCMLAEGLNPSEVTFASLLDACNGDYGLNLGRQMHCFVLKLGFSYHDEFLAISLLGMYMSSRMTTDAKLLFSEFPNPKSTVLWTAIISGHTQSDCSEEALLWYQEMRKYNAMPDQATFASVLRACSIAASLQDGRKTHSLIFHTGFDKDELAGSALVDMYAKCGDVTSSAQVFAEMVSKKDVISWNSMIVGYAKNGYAENAIEVFEEMKRKHVKPDEITFLGVLTACSHGGMVSEGRQIFEDMVSHYGVQPRVDHCACMVDLLGRWGFLKEAEKFIDNLEFEPDAMIWASYLAACILHRDDIRGQLAAAKLIQLEPQNSSPYVLLSNMYAASGNWEGVNSVRREMKEKAVKKFPGCSWIVVGQKTNLFVAGDKFHPGAGDIHAVLKDLTAVMKDEDSGADTELFIMHDEDRCDVLSVHQHDVETETKVHDNKSKPSTGDHAGIIEKQ